MSKLTVREASAIATIIDMAVHGKKVARAIPEDRDGAGHIVYGTARSLQTERGSFLSDDDDVRDAFLRVTSRAGFEHFWPLRELITESQEFPFMATDWR